MNCDISSPAVLFKLVIWTEIIKEFCTILFMADNMHFVLLHYYSLLCETLQSL